MKLERTYFNGIRRILMLFYEESANGEEYRDSKGNWHVKPSVIERESASFEVHNKSIGGRTPINNNASRYHQTAIARDIAKVKKRRS